MIKSRPKSRKDLYGRTTENLEDTSTDKTIELLKPFQLPDVTKQVNVVYGGNKKILAIKSCKVIIRRHKPSQKKYYGSKSSRKYNNNSTKCFAGFLRYKNLNRKSFKRNRIKYE